MVAIVTDSTADIESPVAESAGIEIVPLTVSFGEQSYLDGRELSAEQFFSRLGDSATLPRTSAPSPGAFLRAYERQSERADAVLCITISRKLSGTFNAARAAREHFVQPERIVVMDSEAVTVAEAAVVLGAADAAGHGFSLDEVRAYAAGIITRQDLLVGLETLDYLQRGGRIGRAQAFLGGLLNVKPLLTLREGEVAPAERVRSRRSMIERLYQFALSFPKPESVRIAHAAAREDAEGLAARIGEALPDAPVSISWIGPVVGVYTGPGALGVAVVQRADR